MEKTISSKQFESFIRFANIWADDSESQNMSFLRFLRDEAVAGVAAERAAGQRDRTRCLFVQHNPLHHADDIQQKAVRKLPFSSPEIRQPTSRGHPDIWHIPQRSTLGHDAQHHERPVIVERQTAVR